MGAKVIYALLHVENPASRQRMQRIIEAAAFDEVFSRGMEGYRPILAPAYPVFEIMHKKLGFGDIRVILQQKSGAGDMQSSKVVAQIVPTIQIMSF